MREFTVKGISLAILIDGDERYCKAEKAIIPGLVFVARQGGVLVGRAATALGYHAIM